MKFSTEQVVAATGGTAHGGGGEGIVLTDTRKLAPGCWFLAIVGARFDGHAFLQQAIEAGAVGVICERIPEGFAGSAVVVRDTTVAFQDLGRAARARLTGPVVALTGSSGKTTTRALISCALSRFGSVHQTVGNLNNHLGVPMTLVAADVNADHHVVEMGTSAPGEIQFLAELATPDVRVVINVGPAHLEELGGLDGVSEEKGALLRTAGSDDLLVVNADDARVTRQAPAGIRALRYGVAEGADVRLVSATNDPDAMTVHAVYDTPQGRVETTIPALGAHIAHNGAAAIAVAIGLGHSAAAAAAGLADYAPVGMRMKRETLFNGAIAYNDAYNANPQSVAASMRVLAEQPGRRVAVLGDMLELGPGEGAFHTEIVALAGTLGIDQLVLVGDRMVAAAGAATVPCLAAPSHEAAAAFLRGWLQPSDRALFKGSRGARVEAVLAPLRPSTAGESA